MNVEVSNVTFTYPSGVTALRDVSLSLTRGEAVALIGENGAGKTTLARHLNGLLKPDSGRVLVGEWDTREHTVAQMARRVGYAFQNPDEQLFARRVWDEVAFGPRNLGLPQEQIEQRVQTMLQKVGLSGVEEIHPYDLSQAERRLVSLAAVLAMETPVVLLDEPTMGLDRAGQRRIGQIVEGLKAEERTVITITHDMDFCADHFARIVVMADGRIQADGPAEEILVREELLAAAGVEPPQLVRLGRGIGLPEVPLTIEGFLEIYERWRQEKE